MKQQIKKVSKNVTITIPLYIAETLAAYIDAGIGTSGDDNFSKQMKVPLSKLDKEFARLEKLKQ